tara:strand:- start:348 stop:605 length:258 start_codon:yes stop_codon:yes gene_type:complete
VPALDCCWFKGIFKSEAPIRFAFDWEDFFIYSTFGLSINPCKGLGGGGAFGASGAAFTIGGSDGGSGTFVLKPSKLAMLAHIFFF